MGSSPQKEFYDKVSIGDVGYLHPSEGTFIRLFNVILPWDHPSNGKLGKPEYYESLDWGPFANILKHQFTESRTLLPFCLRRYEC